MSITMPEFQEILSKYDYYYDYSSDHSKWLKGKAQYDEIQRILRDNPWLTDCYRAYCQAMSTGGTHVLG